MKSLIGIGFVLLIIVMGSCTKEMTDYRNFLQDQEKVYPGIVSRLKALTGNQRVLLTWNPSPDPTISKYIIYWNNGADSLVMATSNHNTSDTIKCYIKDLGEYNYYFYVVSSDSKGNRSVALRTNSTKVYGPLYAAGLVNRLYDAKTPSTIKGTDITLNFNVPDTVNINTEIKYTGIDNTEKKVFIGPKVNAITLADCKFAEPILYRSSYKPISNAIDTFYTSKYDRFPVSK